jgi:hypothetical protein
MFVQPPTLSARASSRGMATTERGRALEDTNVSLRTKKTGALCYSAYEMLVVSSSRRL